MLQTRAAEQSLLLLSLLAEPLSPLSARFIHGSMQHACTGWNSNRAASQPGTGAGAEGRGQVGPASQQ